MPKSAFGGRRIKEEGPRKHIRFQSHKASHLGEILPSILKVALKGFLPDDIDEAMDYFHKDFLAINGEDAGGIFPIVC